MLINNRVAITIYFIQLSVQNVWPANLALFIYVWIFEVETVKLRMRDKAKCLKEAVKLSCSKPSNDIEME